MDAKTKMFNRAVVDYWGLQGVLALLATPWKGAAVLHEKLDLCSIIKMLSFYRFTHQNLRAV